MIELYLVWKPKIVSWIILSPTLELVKGVYAWATSKAKNSQDACLPSVSPSHFKQIPKDHNHGSSLPSASPRHLIMIKIQAYRVSSILNGPRGSKWPNFASLYIWFAASSLSLEFDCLFHVSMFLWIQILHVAFNELCLCIYIIIKKKTIQDFQISQKKRKIFKWKKPLDKGHWALKSFKKKNSLN